MNNEQCENCENELEQRNCCCDNNNDKKYDYFGPFPNSSAAYEMINLFLNN